MSKAHGGRPPEALVLPREFPPWNGMDHRSLLSSNQQLKKGDVSRSIRMEAWWMRDCARVIMACIWKGDHNVEDSDRQMGLQMNDSNQLEQEQVGMKHSFWDTLIGGVDVTNRGKGPLVSATVEDPSCSIIRHEQRVVEQAIIEKTRSSGDVQMDLDADTDIVGGEDLGKEETVPMLKSRTGHVFPASIHGNHAKPPTKKTRCSTIFGGVGNHDIELARYGNVVAVEFAVAHAYRARTRQLYQPPWCCLEPG
ncbi:hypothetical protein V6N11_056066 [Hibiscus sabdariffa]|uniref:Uncharacterized protein n=1 Tax=Hibiscus sabdariffa TaxID=183260 RepID=A0ABR2T3K8_9ROSI